MAGKHASIGSGMLLIAFGAIFLAINLSEISWRQIWPLIFFAGAALNFALFFSNRGNVGALMPATTLLVYGALFQYCALTDWDYMSELWPTFILGPGLGFLAMYLFGKRDRGLLVPAAILIGLSTVFFFTFGPLYRYGDYWPVLLILAGLMLLLRRQKQQAV
jgi:hypothetical protein